MGRRSRRTVGRSASPSCRRMALHGGVVIEQQLEGRTCLAQSSVRRRRGADALGPELPPCDVVAGDELIQHGFHSPGNSAQIATRQ